MARGAQDEPGAPAGTRWRGWGMLGPVRRPVLAPQPRWLLLCWDWRGLAGFGGTLERLCRTLCSALPLLAGSRVEGGPSYPDVRRSGRSGGGGEAAACAAITRETAPSCHQLPSRGVLRRYACWRRPGATSGNSGPQPPTGAPQTHPPLPTRTSHRPPRTGTHARAVSGCTQHPTHMATMVVRIVVPARSWWGHQIHPLSIWVQIKLKSTTALASSSAGRIM